MNNQQIRSDLRPRPDFETKSFFCNKTSGYSVLILNFQFFSSQKSLSTHDIEYISSISWIRESALLRRWRSIWLFFIRNGLSFFRFKTELRNLFVMGAYLVVASIYGCFGQRSTPIIYTTIILFSFLFFNGLSSRNTDDLLLFYYKSSFVWKDDSRIHDQFSVNEGKSVFIECCRVWIGPLLINRQDGWTPLLHTLEIYSTVTMMMLDNLQTRL